jgi:hypothetical protein
MGLMKYDAAEMRWRRAEMRLVESRNKQVTAHRFGIRHTGRVKSLTGIPQSGASVRPATFYIEVSL